MSTSLERQMWLEKVVLALRQHFLDCGWTIPQNVRVSIGIPKGMHGQKKAIGQCWSDRASSDGYYEIFSSPEQGAEFDHIKTLAHELVHATVGTEQGHKGLFKVCATDIGFVGPMTSTPSGDKMKAAIQRIINSIGFYPAGKLNINERKKKGTYLIKCECPMCGYLTYTTKKWLAEGDPICPVDNVGMN